VSRRDWSHTVRISTPTGVVDVDCSDDPPRFLAGAYALTVNITSPNPGWSGHLPLTVTATVTGGGLSHVVTAWLTAANNGTISPDTITLPTMGSNTWTFVWNTPAKEPPGDYLVTVQAQDGISTVSQSITITLT
jgi:hypothetical protein